MRWILLFLYWFLISTSFWESNNAGFSLHQRLTYYIKSYFKYFLIYFDYELFLGRPVHPDNYPAEAGWKELWYLRDHGLFYYPGTLGYGQDTHRGVYFLEPPPRLEIIYFPEMLYVLLFAVYSLNWVSKSF